MRFFLFALICFTGLIACGPFGNQSASDSVKNSNTDSVANDSMKANPSRCFLDSAKIPPTGDNFIEVAGKRLLLSGRLLSFKNYLARLDRKDANGVLSGAKTLGTCFEGWQDETRDSAFLVYYTFYYPFVRGFANECPPDKILESLTESEVPSSIVSIKKKLASSGISMIRAEACYVSIEVPRFLEAHTANAVSASMKECIEANTLCEKYYLQVNEQAMDLKSGMWSIAVALAATDSVVRKYPGTLAAQLSGYHYMFALDKFLLGDDVFYVYEGDAKNRKILMPDARSAWENYAKENQATRSGKTVHECYELLRRNNFVLDVKAENQLRKIAGLE